jgi:hypothetical protein
MIFWFDVNVAVISAILFVMLVLYYSAKWNWGPTILAGSNVWAQVPFWLFFAVFLCFLLEYLIGHLYQSLSGDEQKIWHSTIHVTGNLVGNLASLFMLLAAAAYSRGDRFKIRSARDVVLAYSIGIVAWSILFEAVGHERSAFATALATAPVLLLASVAGTALGWAFFVRWGSTAWPFFVVSIVYSLLQLPAYIRGEFGYLDNALGQEIRNSNLDYAYPILAGGKVLLAFGFLSLLCGSAHADVRISEPKNWPTTAVPPPTSYHMGWGWLASLLAGLIIATATQPLGGAILKYLGGS